MNKLPIYTIDGSTDGEVTLPELFATPVDQTLIHRYFVWVRNQLRHTISHTKTRGEVRGGGRKPHKQKGTGRARAGSTRSPIWIGGGITFGPRKERNWHTNMPRTERRKALFSALSAKAADENVVILKEWKLKEPKTKLAIEALSKLPLSKKKTLVVQENDELMTRSLQNIQGITLSSVTQLNIIDILNADQILFTSDSLQNLEKHFTSQS